MQTSLKKNTNIPLEIRAVAITANENDKKFLSISRLRRTIYT